VKVAYYLNERLSLKRLFKKVPRFAEPRTSWLKGSALVMSVWPLNSRGLRQSRLAFLLKLPARNWLVLSNQEIADLLPKASSARRLKPLLRSSKDSVLKSSPVSVQTRSLN
jgi:hypothetical protein